MRANETFRTPKLVCLAYGLAALLLGSACDHEPSVSTPSWGHMAELDRHMDANMFLFGVAARERLNVCLGPLPPGVSADWLKAEIYSAINLWAMSIGRAIAVDFNNCPRPPSLRVVFADMPVRGEFIGYTHYAEGERRLYLNPVYDWEDLGTTLRFAMQPEFKADNWQKKAKFLLPILEQGLYAPMVLMGKGVRGRLKQPTFGTMLHELGHAFGLCDLYQDGSAELGYHSNCSPTHRASELDPNEVMTAGTRPGTARFALTPQDRLGLQKLASRPGFPNHGWGPPKPLSAAKVLALTL